MNSYVTITLVKAYYTNCHIAYLSVLFGPTVCFAPRFSIMLRFCDDSFDPNLGSTIGKGKA